VTSPSIQKTELNQQSEAVNDGDGQQSLCESCDDVDFVHDVLLEIPLFPDEDRLLPVPAADKRNV
jgi:hypothetical protein